MQRLTLEKLSAERYLNLENFLGDLEPSEYLSQLLKEIADLDRKENQYSQNTKHLNPAPYIRAFEQLQSQLDGLKDECKRKKKALETSVKEKEQSHYQNVITQANNASNIRLRYNELTNAVEKLSISTTERVGDKLNKVRKVENNSTTIIKIAKSYNNFYTNGKPTAELIKKNENTAILLKQLIAMALKLANDEKLPKARETYEIIKKFGDDFELDLLESFNEKYKASLYDQLNLTTKTLFAYNNGANIIDFFVRNHPFLTKFNYNNIDNKKNLINEEWLKQLSNPYFTDYQVDKNTDELFKEVQKILISQIDPFSRAFKNHTSDVLLSFISQVFERVLKTRIDYILSYAMSFNKLCYLRALHSYSNGIYDDIISKLKSSLENDNKNLHSELERIYADLFREYLKDDSYFHIEISSLEQLIDDTLNPFINSNFEVIKKQYLSERIRDYKERQENQLLQEGGDVEVKESESISSSMNIIEEEQSVTSDLVSNASTKLTLSSRAMAKFEFYLPDNRDIKEKFKSAKQKVPQSKRLRKFVSKVPFMKANENKNDNYSYIGFSNNQQTKLNKVSNEKCQLSLEITSKVYKFIIESLNRATGLVPTQMTQYTMDLFDLLLTKVGPSYVSIGLASVYHNFIYPFQPGFRSKPISELNLSFLSEFKTISLQLFVMSAIIKKSFFPLLVSESLLDKISVSFNGYIQDVEIGLNIIIEEIIKLIQGYIDSILKSQPINDYLIPMNDSTNTCEQLCRFLDTVLQSIQTNLKFSSSLKMGIISKISSYLLNALITQFTKFKFNDDGISTLANDSVQYLSLFNVLKAGIFELDGTNQIDDADYDENQKVIKDDLEFELKHIEEIQNAYQILNDLPGFFSSTSLQQLRDFANEGRLKYLKKDVLNKFIEKKLNGTSRMNSIKRT